MPTVPSFSGYAQKPNLAQAYLGGQELELGRERIRQQAASDAARISLGYAQLQQEAVANEMELAAKKEALSRQALKTAQEQEIEKAYREAQLGLAQRELKNEEAIAAMRVQEAARGFEREQAYSRIRQQKIAAGVPDPQASQEAVLEVGFGYPGFSGALTPAQPLSEVPALNFRLRQLDATERSIMNRYPGLSATVIKPADKEKLDQIQRERESLQIPRSLQQQNTSTATNQPEVIRRTKDGRRAVFNSQTKQFIRYAD